MSVEATSWAVVEAMSMAAAVAAAPWVPSAASTVPSNSPCMVEWAPVAKN